MPQECIRMSNVFVRENFRVAIHMLLPRSRGKADQSTGELRSTVS